MTTPSTMGVLEQAGPAQNELLTHFCGRPAGARMTPHVPPEIAMLQPKQRLERILWEQRLLGFPPFGANYAYPMLCLSESPPDHLRWLFQVRGWQPWGVMFTRQQVYDMGGGPAWYTRQAQYDTLTEQQRPWAVRLDAAPENKSDWLHEREWRTPVLAANPAVILPIGSVAGIIVGERDWQPVRPIPSESGHYINGLTGEYTMANDPYGQPLMQDVPTLPPLWTNAVRWFWDFSTAKLVRV